MICKQTISVANWGNYRILHVMCITIIQYRINSLNLLSSQTLDYSEDPMSIIKLRNNLQVQIPFVEEFHEHMQCKRRQGTSRCKRCDKKLGIRDSTISEWCMCQPYIDLMTIIMQKWQRQLQTSYKNEITSVICGLACSSHSVAHLADKPISNVPFLNFFRTSESSGKPLKSICTDLIVERSEYQPKESSKNLA